MARSIFRSLFSFYTLTRNDEKLLDIARTFENRWGRIYHNARLQDPELNRMFLRAFSGSGTIELTGAGKAEWHIEDGNGKKIEGLTFRKHEDGTGGYSLRLTLPVGVYTVVAARDGMEKRIPVRVSLSARSRADISRFHRVPEGMVLIPAGEFRHAPEYDNRFSRFSYEDDFLIKRTEVSIGEYLEFWNSLKDDELKKRYASYYFGETDSMRCSRSWDDRGRLLRPNVTLKHPVTGISAAAAEAFCRYLSDKLKRPVMLPSRRQWSKAAGGIDGLEYAWGNIYKEGHAAVNAAGFRPVGAHAGDSSLFGVRDLTGNVREFVRLSSPHTGRNGKYAVVGGSYDTSPAAARISGIAYGSRGGNDVGFRYVMPLGKNAGKDGARK